MNRSVGSKLKNFRGIGRPRSAGFTLVNCPWLAPRCLIFLAKNIAAFFLGLVARELEELDACGANGVWPVIGALGGGYTTGNLVE